MKRFALFATYMAVGFSLPCERMLSAQDTLSPVLMHDVQRLQETWTVLDQLAREVWPGWSNFATVPFLFQYPDGTEMLVGHPNPPKGFNVVRTIGPGGKTVCVNRQQGIRMQLRPPLVGGGGPTPLGFFEGKPVQTVTIHLRAPQRDTSSPRVRREESSTEGSGTPLQLLSEQQILLYAHELFHCYQSTVYKWRYGNLMYNTDENYAAYAEIEGLALERAYTATDTNKAKECLKDFLVARELKRRSMDTLEQRQESEEELMEGLATYAEIRLLELVKSRHVPVRSDPPDPFYHDFVDADLLLKGKVQNLRAARENTMDARGKSYSFGAFQALLLNRFRPGWTTEFYRRNEMLDQEIALILALSKDEERNIVDRLRTRYEVDSIRAKHGRLIGQRNAAFASVQSRQGVSYIINLKGTLEFPEIHASGRSFRLGLMTIYPEGIEKIAIEDFLLTGKKSPMVIDQLYYVKWVDTMSRGDGEGYKLTYSRKEGEDVYGDAVLATDGFVLKAPKIEVVRGPKRVKINIISKIKD